MDGQTDIILLCTLDDTYFISSLFQFGNEKTYAWFSALLVNFFWNVFVESPIKVKLN